MWRSQVSGPWLVLSLQVGGSWRTASTFTGPYSGWGWQGIWVHLLQPLLRQGHLEQVAQGRIQETFEDFQGGDSTTCLGSLCQCTCTGNKFFTVESPCSHPPEMEQLLLVWKIQPRDVSFLISPFLVQYDCSLVTEGVASFHGEMLHHFPLWCVCVWVGGFHDSSWRPWAVRVMGRESAVGCCRQRCPHITCPDGDPVMDQPCQQLPGRWSSGVRKLLDASCLWGGRREVVFFSYSYPRRRHSSKHTVGWIWNLNYFLVLASCWNFSPKLFPVRYFQHFFNYTF